MANEHKNGEELEGPPKFVMALRQLPKEPVFVPPAVDEALMRAARRHLSSPKKTKIRWLRWVRWVAASGGLALVLVLVYPPTKRFLGFKETVYAREDLNHDGRVDILDAFILAKQLKGIDAANPKLDINGDGIVDLHDAESIAAHAVSLEKGGRS